MQDAHPPTSPWTDLVIAAQQRGLTLSQAVDHVASIAAAAHRARAAQPGVTDRAPLERATP